MRSVGFSPWLHPTFFSNLLFCTMVDYYMEFSSLQDSVAVILFEVLVNLGRLTSFPRDRFDRRLRAAKLTSSKRIVRY
jgi:hypothetical protein